jgi:amidase
MPFRPFIHCTLAAVCCTTAVFARQQPRHIHFQPSVWQRTYSAAHTPVLRVSAGDTVSTNSVDAVGFDEKGERVAHRGNPLTGPFYVEGAMPGDVIAITLHDVRLNRAYATTLNALIPKIFPGKATMKLWREAKLIRWNLDTIAGFASPAVTEGALRDLKVPLHPFLGCVGVAAEGDKTPDGGACGDYGGNTDFLFNKTGATMYLPVYHPGALLYFGDGHAAQGDGELNGDALETSMQFSFSTRILKKDSLPLTKPVMEDGQYWMFFGIEKTLDRSLQAATETMSLWLEHHYGLTRREASQVIGPAIQYRIPKTAGGITEVVAMIPKTVLRSMQPGPKTQPVSLKP